MWKGPEKKPRVLFILRLLDSFLQSEGCVFLAPPWTAHDLLPQVDYKSDVGLKEKMAAGRWMPFYLVLLFAHEYNKKASFLFLIAYVTECSTQISHSSGPRRIEIGWG